MGTDAAASVPVGHGKVVVTISGAQANDALSNVMRILRQGAPFELIDFGQLVVRHRFIATAILAPPESDSGSVDLKEMLFMAHQFGFEIDFGTSPVRKGLGSWSSDLGSVKNENENHDEYIVTLFAENRIPAEFFSQVTSIMAEHEANIASINRLTEENDNYMCLELRISVERNIEALEALRSQLLELGRQYEGADIALQQAHINRMAKRMVVFDLSWTLIQGDSVDMLLSSAGVKVSEADEEKRSRGELDDVEWMRTRVAALKGTNADEVNQATFRKLEYTKGARELIAGLKKLGFGLAIVSSGSRIIAERARDDLGMQFAYGNNFEVDAGNRFTGLMTDPVIDADRKADLLQMLAMQQGIDAEQIVAVGDGPVSSKMLSAAGTSVAFDQPGSVGIAKTGQISSKSLAGVLYLLGVTGREFRELRSA